MNLKKTSLPIKNIVFFVHNMVLYITSLNSGSNGNCYYVGNATEAVLVDVGISCRETEIRMKQLGLNIKTVKAIFISHEHSDHIKGVSVLAHKYQIPVYITEATAKNGPRLIKHLSKPFVAKQPITVGDLIVTPFFKQHDAADPHSFIVRYNKITVGIFTDIGIVCEQLIHHFKQCNAAFLEANYDEQMLENGGYPLHLKNRIRGGQGHLSNAQALDLFTNHRPQFMTHLLLSHLSKENNTPQLAKNLFEAVAHNTQIIVADRYSATEIFTITATDTTTTFVKHPYIKPKQMVLFG
jgi:phosphoribosyl 1,2-cyclic phosphodiesterase